MPSHNHQCVICITWNEGIPKHSIFSSCTINPTWWYSNENYSRLNGSNLVNRTTAWRVLKYPLLDCIQLTDFWAARQRTVYREVTHSWRLFTQSYGPWCWFHSDNRIRWCIIQPVHWFKNKNERSEISALSKLQVSSLLAVIHFISLQHDSCVVWIIK